MLRLFLSILILSSLNSSAQKIDSLFLLQKPKMEFHQNIKSDSLFSFRAKTGVVPFFLHCLGEQALAPFHMSKKQIWRTAGAIALTATLIQFDKEIDNVFRPISDKNESVKKSVSEFTELGDRYGFTLVAGIAGISILTKEYRPLHTTVLAAQAALTSGLWVRLGKVLTSRMRPATTYHDSEYNSDHWFGPFAQFNPKYNHGRSAASFDAFPSGHTAAAFAIATTFAKEYAEYKVVPVVAYSLASLVAVSRLVQHEHWASDLVPGAVIGYLCADQVFRYDKKIRMGSTLASLNIYPTFDQYPMMTIRLIPN